MDIVSLELINLNVKFKIFNLQSKIIKKVLINKINKKKENQLKEIHALKDISFRLNAGDRLGIIGKNGSGKTTLLRTLAGIYNPSEGKVLTDGSIKSVLEVNSSGQLDDTVENNIILIGLLHGYKKKEILEKKENIIQFSGLEKFLHLPLSSCSTGMQLRLLFSTLYHFESDIYLIDEFISTGDQEFQEKGLKLIEKYINNKILVFASHDMSLIKKKCNKILLLEKGNQKFFGDIDEGLKLYESV